MTKVDEPACTLYRRPGFLIRRVNQIAIWLFLDETAPMAITPAQYSALVILHEQPDIDQVGLAQLLGIDKSTMALVAGKLEAAGLMRREADANDLRRNVLRITSAGLRTVADLAERADRAQHRLLGALQPDEAETFMGLLARYVDQHTARIAQPGPQPADVPAPETT